MIAQIDIAEAWSLIKPTDTWLLWAVIATGVALSIYLEQTYSWAAKLSAPVLALLMAMLLSSSSIMPFKAPPYDIVEGKLAPLAIPLLLFRANLVRIARDTGAMFVALHLATLGTVIGAIVAGWLFRERLPQIAELCGIMTASYVGGGINFMAVKGTYKVDENLTNPLLVADNVIMAGMFVVMLMMTGSRFFLHHFKHPHIAAGDSDAAVDEAAVHFLRRQGISLLDIAKGMGAALVLVALAYQIKQLVDAHIAHPILTPLLGNMFVLTTFLTVIAATIFSRFFESIEGAQEIGSYLLYMFLFVIGLPADLFEVLWGTPLMFVFCLIIAVPNLLVALALGKLLGISLEEILLASNATLGGPPTAAAMAVSKGWSKLALPALLCGLWGYTIGTVVGVGVTELLRRLLDS